MSNERVQYECIRARQNKSPLFTLEPSEYDLFLWRARILGPDQSPYAGYRFLLTIKCPHAYGIDPPKVTFNSPILHINVNEHGQMALDYLARWSLDHNLVGLCEAIVKALSEPQSEYCLNADLLTKWNDARAKYTRAIRAFMTRHS